MKYKVICVYDIDNVILETNDKQEAIEKLKELDGKYYDEYLSYYQICHDYRPADFYPSYCIQCINGYMYDITDYCFLERDAY